jgi:hypothetical protein
MNTDTPTAAPAATTPAIDSILHDTAHRPGKDIFFVAVDIVRRLKRTLPDSTFDDLETPLEHYCQFRKLDPDTTDALLDYALELMRDGVEGVSIFEDALDLFRNDPSRPPSPPKRYGRDTKELRDVHALVRHLASFDKNGSVYIGRSALLKSGIVTSKGQGKRKVDILRKSGHLEAIEEAHIFNHKTGKLLPLKQRRCIKYKYHETPVKSESDHYPLSYNSITPQPLTPDLDQSSGFHDGKIAGPLEVVEASKSGGGDEAALFSQEPRLEPALGTPDELIAMGVEGRKGGVLGVLPKQTTIPEPKKPKTATASFKGKNKKSKDSLAFALAKPTTQKPCISCGKPWLDHTPKGADDCWTKIKAQSEPHPQTAKLKASQRCKVELMANAGKGKGKPRDEVDKGVVRIIGKYLAPNKTYILKEIAHLISRYKCTAVIEVVYELVDEIEQGDKIQSIVGLLKHRLKAYDVAV